MAKRITPDMERIAKKQSRKKVQRRSTPTTEALKRFKRNKMAIAGLVVIAIFIILAIFADVIAPYDYAEQDYTAILQTPSWAHPMGTDNYGRDILTRIIYGTRISLPIGIICVCVCLVIGGGLGISAAYYGGAVENVIMRIMDIFQAIPATLMSIAIVAALGNSMVNLVLAISISMVPMFARTTRAAIYTVKENEYIEASKAIGAGGIRQMLVHMLPNALGPIIVTATFSVATNILIVSCMSYLGLGITPPTPEWGSILNAGKVYMLQYPHFLAFPGLMIVITVLALNLFGDGLRDALDPRLK